MDQTTTKGRDVDGMRGDKHEPAMNVSCTCRACPGTYDAASRHTERHAEGRVPQADKTTLYI
jgi:hypothetical protein